MTGTKQTTMDPSPQDPDPSHLGCEDAVSGYPSSVAYLFAASSGSKFSEERGGYVHPGGECIVGALSSGEKEDNNGSSLSDGDGDDYESS